MRVFSSSIYGPHAWRLGHKLKRKNKDPSLTVRTETTRLVRYLLCGLQPHYVIISSDLFICPRGYESRSRGLGLEFCILSLFFMRQKSREVVLLAQANRNRRVSRTTHQTQTRLGLSLSSSDIFQAIVSRLSSPHTSQQTQTRLGLSLSSSNFFRRMYHEFIVLLAQAKRHRLICTDCARAFTLLHRLNLRYGCAVLVFTVTLWFIQYRINLRLRGNS